MLLQRMLVPQLFRIKFLFTFRARYGAVHSLAVISQVICGQEYLLALIALKRVLSLDLGRMDSMEVLPW
jgi:hypothetical protein